MRTSRFWKKTEAGQWDGETGHWEVGTLTFVETCGWNVFEKKHNLQKVQVDTGCSVVSSYAATAGIQLFSDSVKKSTISSLTQIFKSLPIPISNRCTFWICLVETVSDVIVARVSSFMFLLIMGSIGLSYKLFLALLSKYPRPVTDSLLGQEEHANRTGTLVFG